MVPPLLPHLPEGTVMTAKTAAAAETAYKIWLGHTYQCAACRTAPCVTAIRLGRAWREARR
ncbi:hypothetical protein F558DRAFT_06189 [Streptomyces sp. AmelKG-A3]|nr:hypothetical protein F558DRAFT_06189 [Streptomyces sp. AmelKG-A3]